MEPHNTPRRVSYRNIKYPRIEFKTGEFVLILPYGVNPNDTINKHANWIVEKTDFINKCLKDSSDKETSNRTEEEFKTLVHRLAESYSAKLDVKLNKIRFRKMQTKWGSLSSGRNLTANTLMKHLPEHLIEYVVFHETAHIIEKRHNDKFWKIVSNEFSGYREMERELFVYWFRIVK